MQITEQTHVIYTFKLTVAETLILKEMLQNSYMEEESEERTQFRANVWNALPSIEILQKETNNAN